MKVCVDCVWCVENRDSRESVNYCTNPKLGFDVVTGKTRIEYCKNVRVGSSLETKCGMEAKWFESKRSIISKWWSKFNKKAQEE